MRKVVAPTFKELLLLNFKNSNDYYDKNQKIFNPYTYILITSIILIIRGYWQRESLILGLSFLSFLVYYYLRYRKIIYSIYITRKHKKDLKEKDDIQIEYNVMNRSNFSVDEIFIKDYSDAFEEKNINFYIDQKINPNSVFHQKKKRIQDGGMGIKNFKELKAYVFDPLHIFKFYSINETKSQLNVYPHIENIPQFKIPFNKDSFHFGEIDIPIRGDSVNFMGTKSYIPGDPIKNINWRQSAKGMETIVNYFEKNVNKSISILLNIDYRLHSGSGQYSSLEYLKDITLGLIAQHISNGNEITLKTNQRVYPSGSGQSFINQMELTMFSLELINDQHVSDLVKRNGFDKKSYPSSGEALIYITPATNGPLYEKSMQQILELSYKGFDVQIISINPIPYLAEKIQFGSIDSLRSREALLNETINKWMKTFKSAGVMFFDIEINESPLFDNMKKASEKMWKEK